MKQYKKLQLPKDSAWDRKFRWGRFVHWRIRHFLQGVQNIIRWIPIIYKDKDWDDYYITKMLQKKIEHQREHLVNSNRHTRVDQDNYWMTVVLNLIERDHEECYGIEYQEYVKEDLVFNDDRSITFKLTEDNSDAYLYKYRNALRRMIKENYMNAQDKMNNGRSLAFLLSRYNQDRCHKLLYKILERHLQSWWD